MSFPLKILLLGMTMQEQKQLCTSHEALPMQKLKLQHKVSPQVMKAYFVQNSSFPDQIAHPCHKHMNNGINLTVPDITVIK